MNTYNDTEFIATKKIAEVTFSGWDGKSYNGEGRNLRVYVNPAYPDKEFVRLPFRAEHYDGTRYTARCYFLITGERHKKSGIRKAEYCISFDPITP